VQLLRIEPPLIVSHRLSGFAIDQCHFIADHLKRATGRNTLRRISKRHVCFTPESGHVQRNQQCLLWAKADRLVAISPKSG
jgi:hypothetical protein